MCPLTRLHCRITQNDPVHNAGYATALPVDRVDFKVKGALSIQSAQGECGLVQGEIVEQAATLCWTGLIRLQQKTLRKTTVEAGLASYFDGSACPIYYTTVFHRLRYIYNKQNNKRELERDREETCKSQNKLF